VVSVLLPAFNAQKTIGRAIDSIRNQSLRDWDLVIVDDGSTDQTAAIVFEAARHDPRIRLHRQARRGLVDALNKAISLAHGSLLARMDADDASDPDRLALQAAFLEENHSVGLVASRVQFGGDPIRASGFARYVDWSNSVLSPESISLSRFIESPLVHPSVMFRRDLVTRWGGYRKTAWPEDYELWLRWLEAGVRMEKLPQQLLLWNDPTDRLSRRHSRYRIDAFYACKCHYLSKWIASQIDPARPIMLWGAGRITRKRFRALDEAGPSISGFIDINPRKIGLQIRQRPVYGISDIPGDREWFVIGGVGNRGARHTIRRELEQLGYREGRDSIMAA